MSCDTILAAVVSSEALAGGVVLVANKMIVVAGFGVTRDTDG